MLKISIVQSDIFWEDKSRNLISYEKILIGLSGKTDLAIFPEMFTTGFTMQVKDLAETNEEYTVQTLQKWASGFGMALAGSFIAKDISGKYFNRGFFITPEGNRYFYDKRHLFRVGKEHETFSPGEKQLIVDYKGWKINLIICYDLRFPVWIRNVDNTYDLLICCANWPNVRKKVWETLLEARAYENYCYVCGVNRIGTDGEGLSYDGNSLLIDPRGHRIIHTVKPQSVVRTATIYKEPLDSLRKKFPAWMDADRFLILEDLEMKDLGYSGNDDLYADTKCEKGDQFIDNHITGST